MTPDRRSPAPADAPPFAGAVDVHHHAVPGFYLRALADAGLAQSVPGVDFPAWDPEASLALMDRHGIARAMLSISAPGVSTLDPLAIDLAARVNDHFAVTIDAHPGRFGAFAALPLPYRDATLAEIRRSLDDLRLDGVGLFTNYDGTYVADPAFDPILTELDRRRATVFLHPAAPPGAPADLPASLVEFVFDTTRAVTQMLYARTFDRYPGIDWILAHAGGAVPYLADRLTFGGEIAPELAGRASQDPLASLQRQHYDLAMSASRFSLPSLRAFAGPSRMLFGSDFPFQREQAVARNIARLERHGQLRGDDARAVAHANADALLGGPGPRRLAPATAP